MPEFVHLHLHSQYSLLDGANRLPEVVAAAREAGMGALALTDHGNVFGAIEFYRQARAAGVKPILGMEAYVAQGSRLDRERSNSRNNHLVLLVENETGYKNLLKLTSRSFLEGFYYKPRVDRDLLRRHSEGLIGLSACLKGEICERLVGRRLDEAEDAAREMREIFGEENFFLELQDHGLEQQRTANEGLVEVARRTGIPLVATNDCHYLAREDSFAHDVLLCIGTQKTLSDPDRLRYASDQFYLKGAEEMASLFPDHPEAIDNTVRIAERCHLELREGRFHLPAFPVPDGYTLDSYFEHIARSGLEERLEKLRRRGADVLEKFSPDLYRQRLAREIEVIERMGFAGYFLIVWDFVRQAREADIPVGPGRGSAAGSLVAYALRITDIDPLQYGLLFERFLNPERVSLPDIDIDFCMRRRSEVIQYVAEKYGRDHVAQIITFGTLAAKAVIRDVGRVMGTPYSKVDRVAKLVPDMTRSLKKASAEIPALREESERDEEVQRIFEVGERLEGLTRHASLHAAGVVITPRPIDELVPLYKTSKDEIVTQWDKDVIEELGLLKMDFLGLRTLTVIDDTVRLLTEQGVDLDLDRVPLDDPATFELFCDGRTNGIFQFESGGMKDLLRRAQPSKFEDLVAFNALYRPGALSVGMVEKYIQRKQGKEKVRYVLPETEAILRDTYGVIAYQEQVMQIAVEVAGFSMGEADILRKAMGKKKIEVMAPLKQKFIDGAAARGFPKAKARQLWDYIEPFAGYGFNKSHSVAYAMLAYKTAYLKAHHPVTFLAAMLTSEMGSKDNVAKYMNECRSLGIPVLPPDVNESNWDFTVVGETIRFGLGAVKGIGSSAVESILAARRHVGRFESLTHFACQVDLAAVNRKAFECLIKSGSFDELGPHRAAMYEVLDRVLDFAAGRRRDRELGQGRLFAGAAMPEPGPDAATRHWPEAERLRAEYEVLSFYLTGHPLSEFSDELGSAVSHTTRRLREEGAEGSVTLGGIVTRLRKNKIKSGKNAGRLMARFVLEDLEGTVPAAVFSDQLDAYAEILRDDALVLITGTARDRGADRELTVERIEPLARSTEPRLTCLELVLETVLPNDKMLDLRECLIEHRGETPLLIELALDEGSVRIKPEERFTVRADDSLFASLEAILGPGCLRKRFEPLPA